MEFIIVIVIGIVAATGALNPNKQDPEEIAKVPETEVTTPVVKEPEPQPISRKCPIFPRSFQH